MNFKKRFFIPYLETSQSIQAPETMKGMIVLIFWLRTLSICYFKALVIALVASGRRVSSSKDVSKVGCKALCLEIWGRLERIGALVGT